MSQPDMGNAATIIQILLATLLFCLSAFSTIHYFQLRRIKKNGDDLWAKLNENHKECEKDRNRISIIETTLSIKNGGS